MVCKHSVLQAIVP